MTSDAHKPKLKAAVFDVDGMLLDTREYIFQAYEYAFKKYNLSVPERSAMAQQVGRVLSTAMYNLAPDSDNELLSEAHNYFLSQNLHLITAYDGLLEMLEKLRSNGLKLAVFSSRAAGFKASLDQAGVTKFLDVVVDASMVKKHKPNPEGLLKALELLKVEPEKAAMLGDAVVDIEAGKAAGVALTVGVTHGFGLREALEKAKPDYLVDSLFEIPEILLGKNNH
jgi:pyrophosphatase PpaX